MGFIVLVMFIILGDDFGRFLIGLVFIMGFMSDVRKLMIIGYIDWGIHWPTTYLCYILLYGLLFCTLYPVFKWLCLNHVCRPCPDLAIILFPWGFLLNLAIQFAPLPLSYVFLEWFKKDYT